MSDDADRAQWRIAKDLQVAMAHACKIPTLHGDGRCHFCDEVVAHELVFCDKDCRDDFEKEQAARQRAGIRAG